MPTTLPNLPNLAGTNVTPNVPVKTLADTDITIVNQSASLGVGADRQVTLAQLKAHLVAPITDALDTRLDLLEPKVAALQVYDAESALGTQWATTTDLTAEAEYFGGSSILPAGTYIVSAACNLEIIGGGASTLIGTIDAHIATTADAAQVGSAHKQYVSLLGSGNYAISFQVPDTIFVGVPNNTTFTIRTSLGQFTRTANDLLWFERRIIMRRIA
jgi:hypothetical protein